MPRAAAAVATWTKVAPTASPSGRFKAAMAYDRATKQLVLFGGGTSGGSVFGDSWTWDGATWTQLTPVTSPSARAGAGMAYDVASGQLIMFGGNTGGAPSGETWSWTGTNWVQLHPATSPPPEAGAAMAYDSATVEDSLVRRLRTGALERDLGLERLELGQAHAGDGSSSARHRRDRLRRRDGSTRDVRRRRQPRVSRRHMALERLQLGAEDAPCQPWPSWRSDADL